MLSDILFKILRKFLEERRSRKLTAKELLLLGFLCVVASELINDLIQELVLIIIDLYIPGLGVLLRTIDYLLRPDR